MLKRVMTFISFALPIVLGIGMVVFGFNSSAAPSAAPVPETMFSATDPDTYDPKVEIEEVTPGKAHQPFVLGEGPLVAVPSLEMQSPLVATGSKDGWLTLPDPPLATWYEKTSAPGAVEGNTLIASHVDFGHGDAAPFSQLHKIQKGAPILVRDFEGTMHEYKADSIQVYERQAVPADLFEATGKNELVLVTCSGPSINAGEASYYMYNLVVTATPVSKK